jgi:outer membrane protein assembly factor BamB
MCRCYRNRITSRYFITSESGGSDFLDFESGTELPNPWIRSTCGIGPLPCNGLYYVGPPACSCNNNVLLNAMNALSAEPGLTRSDQPIQVKTDHTLTKGPAYSKISELKSAKAVPADDWPTYRQNNARTGATRNKVPAELTKHWETKLGAGASAPIIAAGMVFAADVDGHAVCAMNVTDGKIAWRFVADGRVDSPPTYYQGLLLFGSRDGTAYCLRAVDGALVWRFAPLERRLICAYEQPESAWPIHGSILIRKGLAYFAAGRNSFTDGGIFLYALDPRSGKVIHHKRMYGPFGKNGLPVPSDLVGNSYMIEGFRSDIFVADEKRLYLGQQAFEPDLSPVKPQDVKQPHLIPSYGFLEAIPQHRTFWTIDTSLYFDIPTGRGGIQGDILAIDGKRFYEVRGYTPHRNQFFDPREKGYTLYAGTFGPYDPPKKNQLSTWLQNWKKNSDPSGIAPSNKLWASNIPLTGKAIVLAGDVVFVAGTPVVFPEGDLGKAYEGRMGGVLWAASASTGEKLAQYTLDAPPAWDGLAAAGGKLYLTTKDGKIICFVHNQ